MGGDDRLRRHRERVVEGLVRDVRDVDDHSQPVHLPHDLAAEIGQAVVHRPIGGCVRPVVVAEVRERHRPDAEPVIDAEHGQVVGDLVAALEGEHGGDLAGLGDALHVRRGRGQLDLVGMRVEDRLHSVTKLQRAAHGLRALVEGGHPQREVGRDHARVLEPRQVDVPPARAPRDVLVAVEDALQRVDVAVDADEARVDAARVLRRVLREFRRTAVAFRAEAQE